MEAKATRVVLVFTRVVIVPWVVAKCRLVVKLRARKESGPLQYLATTLSVVVVVRLYMWAAVSPLKHIAVKSLLFPRL